MPNLTDPLRDNGGINHTEAGENWYVNMNGTRLRLGERYSGPPSKLYPLLRDIAEEAGTGAEYIKIELDLKLGRTIGYVMSYTNGDPPRLYINTNLLGAKDGSMGGRSGYAFDKILAFRILAIEP